MKVRTKKQQKLLIGLIIGTIISILVGILLMALLSKDNKILVEESITNFMKQIKLKNLHYDQAFLSSIAGNGLEWVLLFFLGMSIIGIPITLFLFFSHSLILGFSISSLIHVYHLKGVIFALIYCSPLICNLVIFLFLSYFSLLFSKNLFCYLFLKREVYFRKLMKKYGTIFGISFLFLLLSSVLEVFLVPQLLAMFL